MIVTPMDGDVAFDGCMLIFIYRMSGGSPVQSTPAHCMQICGRRSDFTMSYVAVLCYAVGAFLIA